MAALDMYYSLTLTVAGSSTGAYYAITPTANLTISQGGATFAPNAPTQQMTSVSIYPQTLQVNAAPGDVKAGVNIIADVPSIDGTLIVSPPIDVATVVTLYGVGGQQIGQYIADPGSGGGIFKFPITREEGISAKEAPGVLHKLLGS